MSLPDSNVSLTLQTFSRSRLLLSYTHRPLPVPPRSAGLPQDDSEWMVVDAGSVVVHVFQRGYREEYALEELWGAPGGRNIRRVAPKPTLHTLDTLSA